MIDLLLGASAAGGIVFLLWLLTYPLSKKYFKASWHYAVLKMTMAFMIVPIGIFAPMFGDMLPGLPEKPDMPDVSEKLQAIKIDAEAINTANAALSKIVFPAGNRFSSPPKPEEKINGDTGDIKNPAQPERNPIDIPYLQIIWLVAAALLFAGGTRKMRKFKKHILKFSGSDVGRETSELFLQCKRQLKVRGQITLRTSGYIKTPLTFGLIRPFVVFPETDMTAEEKRIALIHELTHIKNGDLWIKFIAFVISAVHWFNPFTHLLNRKISVISEEYCDECAIKTMTKEERFSYGNLILKVVCDISAPQAKFCSTLSAPTKNLKRRLSNMMNTKKSRRGMVALSVLAALIICSFATIYAFAANAATPTNSIPSYSESPETFPYIHSINEAKSNVLAYMNDNGEMMYSDDGGKTWVTEENFDFGKYINTPEVPDLETWTYDEVKAWIENSKAELQLQKSLGEITQEQLDDIFEMYDNWLICIKRYLVIGDNGSSTWLTKEEFDKAYPAPELEFWTYDEYKTWIDEQKIELHKKIGEIPGWTQETVDGIIRYYGDNLEVIKGGDVKISKNGRSDISSYACTVRHTLPDGEEISMGFAAFSSGELYKLVKTYLDGQVEAGKMTQTEADGLLAGLTQDSTRLTFDSEGNRVK